MRLSIYACGDTCEGIMNNAGHISPLLYMNLLFPHIIAAWRGKTSWEGVSVAPSSVPLTLYHLQTRANMY